MVASFAAVALGACLVVRAAPSLSSRQISTSYIFNTNTTYQTIDGFGFSTAFQRANLIVDLPETQRKKLIDLLFNTTSGAGFSIVRNGIGSSPDSSSDHMNSILPVSPGSPDAEPQYVWDGVDSGQLWVSQQAKSYGVNRIYANAWSAPGFMKTNGDDANGGNLCGLSDTSCATGSWTQAYADYLVKYIQLYQESGVPITDLGFLNEPDLNPVATYAGMQISGPQAAEFIRILAPTLAAANLSSVGITCCDTTGWSNALTYLSQLQSAGAESLLTTITSHEYSSNIINQLPTSKKVWQSEFSDLAHNWTTDWYTPWSGGLPGDGYTWADNIINGLTFGNVSAYLFWEAVQDAATNNNNNEKLILVDPASASFTVSKRFWAFAAFRHVRPGAVRIKNTGGDGASLRVVSFRNTDGTIAVVALNESDQSASFLMVTPGFAVVDGWAKVTDNYREMQSWAMEPSHAVQWAMGTAVPPRAVVSVLLSRERLSVH